MNAHETSHFKIGVSNNLKRRIRGIQNGNPLQINIVCTLNHKNDYNLEKKIHNYLAEFRMKGEWFNLDKSKLDLIVSKYGFQKNKSYENIIFNNQVASELLNNQDVSELKNKIFLLKNSNQSLIKENSIKDGLIDSHQEIIHNLSAIIEKDLEFKSVFGFKEEPKVIYRDKIIYRDNYVYKPILFYKILYGMYGSLILGIFLCLLIFIIKYFKS